MLGCERAVSEVKVNRWRRDSPLDSGAMWLARPALVKNRARSWILVILDGQETRRPVLHFKRLERMTHARPTTLAAVATMAMPDWKIRVLDEGPDPALTGYERRKVYDAARPGGGNQGHTFGDHFTDLEPTAVIEYLKTL